MGGRTADCQRLEFCCLTNIVFQLPTERAATLASTVSMSAQPASTGSTNGVGLVLTTSRVRTVQHFTCYAHHAPAGMKSPTIVYKLPAQHVMNVFIASI